MIYLWAAITLLEVLLFVLVGTRDRRYPFFAAYVLFCALGSLLLWLVYRFAVSAYIPLRLAEQAMEPVFLLAVAFELLRFVFWPIDVLTFAQRRTFFSLLSALIAVSVAVSFLWPCVYRSPLTSLLTTFDRAVMGFACGSILLIFWLSRRLGIPWRKRAHGIAAGFLLYLPVRVTVTACLSGCPTSAIRYLSFIQMTAFLVSVMTWIFCFSRPDTRALRVTAEQLQPVMKLLEQLKLEFRAPELEQTLSGCNQ